MFSRVSNLTNDNNIVKRRLTSNKNTIISSNEIGHDVTKPN